MKRLLELLLKNPELQTLIYRGKKYNRSHESSRRQNGFPFCVFWENEETGNTITFSQNDYYKSFSLQLDIGNLPYYMKTIKNYKIAE